MRILCQTIQRCRLCWTLLTSTKVKSPSQSPFPSRILHSNTDLGSNRMNEDWLLYERNMCVIGKEEEPNQTTWDLDDLWKGHKLQANNSGEAGTFICSTYAKRKVAYAKRKIAIAKQKNRSEDRTKRRRTLISNPCERYESVNKGFERIFLSLEKRERGLVLAV